MRRGDALRMMTLAMAGTMLAGCAPRSTGADTGSPAAVVERETLGAADAVMSGGHASHGDHASHGGHAAGFEARHMELTPARPATASDSARARALVRELRAAIAPYRDTSVAARDGYRIFLPQLKGQRVYHFTSRRRAVGEAFRWDPAKPTSLLYSRDAAGRFTLVGAMYTMPARASVETLDERVPLSIARWHKHVNWCLPPRGERARWLETHGGVPVFGPRSPIATREGCEAVGGEFRERVFGWMVHANVFAGDDLGTVFGDGH